MVDCTTIGFEGGSLAGWILTNGELDGITDTTQLRFVDEVPGTLEDGHHLTKVSEGNDPIITREAIPVVAPGSRYSIRIGNTKTGARFDRIRTTLLVSSDNALFQYKFAVVFQDPHHKPLHQPALQIRILNANQAAISCGSYDVSAARTLAGFTTQDKFVYRNWTTGLIDLRAYQGQRLTIEVTTHDCAEGAHFGYAYFDAQCLKAEIKATTFCSNRDTMLVLSAPPGFDHYQWNTGDTTRSLTINPRLGDRYAVNIRSFSSSGTNCQLQLQYQVTEPVTVMSEHVTVCAGESYHLGDSTYSTSGTYRTAIRRLPLCDSVVVTHLTVLPVVSTTQQRTICAGDYWQVGDQRYTREGTYITRIKRADPLCDSIVTTYLSLTDIPLRAIPDQIISLGDSVQLSAFLPSSIPYTFSWSPIETLSCSSCETPWARPLVTTQYILSVQTTNPACQVSLPVTVTVNPCPVAIPSAFSPNHDGINDWFTIVASSCVRQMKGLTIYNRWGEILFYQPDLPGSDLTPGWDGMYKGKPVNSGVYSYQLQVELISGDVSHYSGTLTVLP